MSEQQDWAEKLAEEMIKRNSWYPTLISNIENQTIEIWARTLKLDIAQALKKEREIATLESETKYKKIQWPSRKEVEAYCESIDGDGTAGYGVLMAFEWLKSYIENSRK